MKSHLMFETCAVIKEKTMTLKILFCKACFAKFENCSLSLYHTLIFLCFVINALMIFFVLCFL